MRCWLVCALAALGSAAPAAPPVREVRVLMGSTAEVAAEGLPDPSAVDGAFAAMGRVDRLMSLWKESELRALNRDGSGRLSPDTLAVLSHALAVAAASDGAFDPTVEPLVRARGGYGGRAREVPARERESLLKCIGFGRVTIDEDGRVRLPEGGGLDLDGIAKGYACDLAMEFLRRAGARSAVVDLGSSSTAVFGAPVELAVRNPETRGGAPWARFVVEEGAVATSGSDQRGGHILDPRTGLPASRLLSATVVAQTGVEADALSTAIFVLGARKGLALAERRGAAALVLYRRSGRRVVETTSGFGRRFHLEAAEGVKVTPSFGRRAP
jgi:thiamine biosynthesis lipoprotein